MSLVQQLLLINLQLRGKSHKSRLLPGNWASPEWSFPTSVLSDQQLHSALCSASHSPPLVTGSSPSETAGSLKAPCYWNTKEPFCEHDFTRGFVIALKLPPSFLNNLQQVQIIADEQKNWRKTNLNSKSLRNSGHWKQTLARKHPFKIVTLLNQC